MLSGLRESCMNQASPTSADHFVPPQATKLTFALLIFSMILWSSSSAISKFALVNYSPLFMTLFRVGLTAIILTPIVLLKFMPPRFYSKKDFWLIIVLLLFDPLGYFTFEALAMKYTSASQAGMVFAMAPIFTVLAAWLILKEGTTLPVIVCFIVAAVGIVIISISGEVSVHAPNPILGNFIQFLVMCCGTAFMLIIRFMRGRYHALFLVWLQCVGASLVLLPFLFSGVIELPQKIEFVPSIALLYLALGVTLGAQTITCYTVARIPIPRSSAFSNFGPIFRIMFGIFLLGETLTSMQWWACGIVLCAVLASQYFQMNRYDSRKNV